MGILFYKLKMGTLYSSRFMEMHPKQKSKHLNLQYITIVFNFDNNTYCCGFFMKALDGKFWGVVTPAKEVLFSLAFVRLSVSMTTHKQNWFSFNLVEVCGNKPRKNPLWVARN